MATNIELFENMSDLSIALHLSEFTIKDVNGKKDVRIYGSKKKGVSWLTVNNCKKPQEDFQIFPDGNVVFLDKKEKEQIDIQAILTSCVQHLRERLQDRIVSDKTILENTKLLLIAS